MTPRMVSRLGVKTPPNVPNFLGEDAGCGVVLMCLVCALAA
jgi:hypothetical protein